MPDTSNPPADSAVDSDPASDANGAPFTSATNGSAPEQASLLRPPATPEAPPDTASPVMTSPEEPAAPQFPAAEPAINQGSSTPASSDQKPATPSATPKESPPKSDPPAAQDETDATARQRMEAKYGPALLTDMNDAQILLSYITRNGLQEERKVSDETIQSIIASRHRLRTGEFDCETEEGPFRKNFGYLARAALPVSVASLRDSLPTKPQRRWFFFMEPEPLSAAERTCFKYRNYAMWVLILLLVSQIYWTISSSVVAKSASLLGEILKAPTLAEYTAAETEKTAHKPSPASDAKSSTPDPSSTTAKVEKATLTFDEFKSKSAELQTNYSMLATLMAPFTKILFKADSDGLIDLQNQNNDYAIQVANLQSKVDDLNGQVASLSTGATGATGADKTHAIASSAKKALASASEIAANTPSANTPSAGPTPNGAAPDNANPLDPAPLAPVGAGPPPNGARNDDVRAVAGQVIDVMQKWFLPLLYGALGAMVYVVRTLSLQARDRLYRKEALVALNLRVYLGMISGLAIGWFWNHDSQSVAAGGPVSITALSPFALAFIAGYGVELFFTMLDKLVSAFTAEPPRGGAGGMSR
jgi:hypothetical protein